MCYSLILKAYFFKNAARGAILCNKNLSYFRSLEEITVKPLKSEQKEPASAPYFHLTKKKNILHGDEHAYSEESLPRKQATSLKLGRLEAFTT